MKKPLHLSIFLVLLVFLTQCEKEQPNVIKLDYTSYYESAAYALAYAEENYDAALKTNDSSKIRETKQKLEWAKKTFEESKKIYDKSNAIGSNSEKASALKRHQDIQYAAEKAKAQSQTQNPVILSSASKSALTPTEKRKLKWDSINRVNKENLEKFNAKIKADIEKSNAKAKADLENFGKDVKDFFEGKKK